MSACPLRLTPQRALSPAEVMFGGIWIGPGSGEHGDGQRPDLGRENALATVRAAVEAGIREFDTAPWYGAGASEERLGQALNALPDELRADLLVITKAGRLFRDEDGMPCGPGFDAPDRRPLWSRVCVNDYTAEGARISLQESLERLNLTSGGPRVGLRIHDPNDNSNSRAGAHGGWADEVGVALRGDGMCSGLRELRAAGSICHVSLGMNCNREPHQGAPEGVLRLLRGCPAGTFDSALLAGGWNLLCTEGITCMEECQRMGLPVRSPPRPRRAHGRLGAKRGVQALLFSRADGSTPGVGVGGWVGWVWVDG
jgi:D-threo-aldose 1-dehydrogenase